MEENKDGFFSKLLKKIGYVKENDALSALENKESVRIIIPGAIDFSLVFEGEKKEVLDDIFERIKDLMSFMAERNEEMEKTLKTHHQLLENQREDIDISVA